MYRYSQKRYSKLLLNLGCIRIGTLHDFRRSEHKDGIRDPQEGTKEVFHHIDELFIADSEDPAIQASKDVRALSVFNAVKMTNSRNITFKNVVVSRQFNHDNCFLLCSSRNLSIDTMRQFDGADSCVQIVDIPAFYQLLTSALAQISPVRFRGVFEVRYQKRREQWNGENWGSHPATIKEPQFAIQAELRAIWESIGRTKIAPVVVGDYRLGKYCKEVSLALPRKREEILRT